MARIAQRFMLVFLMILLLSGAGAHADLVVTRDGLTVYDTVQGITWLQNGDLAANAIGQNANPYDAFGVLPCTGQAYTDCVTPSGAMDYQAATTWVQGLNKADYAGHNNWQLPTTPNGVSATSGCTSVGAQSNGFAYGCVNNGMGSLYYGASSLNLTAPASANTPAALPAKGFTNLQAGQYWTATPVPGTNPNLSTSGFHTFNFATGWSGSNQGADKTFVSGPNAGIVAPQGVIANSFFVLPMLPAGTSVSSLGAQVVGDPVTGDYFLANGNFGQTVANSPALQQEFGISVCSGAASLGTVGAPAPAPCLNADGSMSQTSAAALVAAMAAAKYLGTGAWALPPSTVSGSCAFDACATAAAAAKDPLASLYYNVLNLPPGGGGLATGATGPFVNVQPNLYWSCPALGKTNAASTALLPCDSSPQCDPATDNTCGSVMDWSFNFADGFTGTDEAANVLFVTAYYVDEPQAFFLLLPALGLLAIARRRRRHSAA